MSVKLNRREFGKASGLALAAAALPALGQAQAAKPSLKPRILKSIKFGMFGEKLSIVEKFKVLQEIGYDGVELNSPGGVNKDEALAASRVTEFPIHGVVDSIHWGTRLSSPDKATRRKGLEGLKTAIHDASKVGGSAVLLVPGAVRDAKNENAEQVWDRSIEQIRLLLPLAEKLKIHILIETVWNGFCYKPEQFRDYIDEIDSPWVQAYYDIGNMQKFAPSHEWIRILGKRTLKLDVKDWGSKNGFCPLGQGDVNWKEVLNQLEKTEFSGWATREGNDGGVENTAQLMNELLAL